MRRRTRAGKIESLGDVLGKILKKRKISLNLPLNRSLNPEDKRITAAWNKAVGDRIAAHTNPDKLQRGTLFVKVSDSVWMQQLHFLKQDILGKIKQQLDGTAVQNIHFSLGKIPLPPAGHELPPEASYSLKARDRKMIDENTASIADPELRDILKKVMTREISRRRLREEKKAP
jgi:hypothetical protein